MGIPANTGDTLKTEIQYTANSDFSNPLLLSDVPYPSAEYTQLGIKSGAGILVPRAAGRQNG